MSRHPLARRPVRAVLATTVAVASLVGLGHASAAPPVTYAVTGVSPAFVQANTGDAFGVTLTGKGFTRHTRVAFGACSGAVAVAPSTLTATKLVVQPPACAAGPVDITVSEVGAPARTSTLKDRFAFVQAPVVATGVPAVTPATGPWTGGTLATVLVEADVPAKAPVQVLVTTAGSTKVVPGKVDAADARRISFKVPAGVPGAQPSVAVSTYGIVSTPVEQLFTWKSTIKTSPAVWVRGAATPTLKIDGMGFSKGAATVRVCGVTATPVVGKAPTDKSLVVTPPAWAAVAGAGVDPTEGGVCTVQVSIAGGETSTVTAGSTFTYAAF